MKNRTVSRVFSLILTLALVVSCLSAVSFTADAIVSGEWLAVSQTVTDEAQTVEVPIKLGTNPGFISAQVTIGYDDTVFTLTEVRDASALGEANHTSALANNPYKLSWENDLLEENLTVADTVVATLVFAIDENAAAGEYVFTVTPVAENTIDAALEYVAFTGTNGTVTITCTHNYVFDHMAVEPTCEGTGTGVYICTKCGDEDERTELATGHDYQAGPVTPPTCTEQGYTTYVCTHDANHTEKRDFTPTVAHNFVFVEYTVAPNCEAGGKALWRCTACSTEEIRDAAALGHDYQAGPVTPPTCTEQGYTTYVCTHNAEHTYQGNFTDALGHNLEFVENTVEPTCTEGGKALWRCTRCPYEETRDVEALGHDYEAVVTPPTYFEQGYTTYTCKHDPSHTYIADYVDPIVDGNSPTVYAETVRGQKGQDVTVTVSIRNNPGITGTKIRIGYNAEVLTLTNVADGGILGTNTSSADLTANPYALVWENDTEPLNFTADGVLATLTFHINDEAENGDYAITVTVVNEMTINAEMDEVPLLNEDGSVKVAPAFLIGDVDGNGEIEPLDRMMLARYLAEWEGYDDIDLNAADIDQNGEVEPIDRMILARYLADWEGYDQYFA